MASREWAARHAQTLHRRWKGLTPRERLAALAATLIVAAIVIFVLIFDWNWLRGPVGGFLSARLHRRVEIVGDLEVHPWSFQPRVTAHDFRIGQPAWAGTGDMARVGAVTIQIKALPLLRGQVILPLLAIQSPDLKLIRDKTGRSNWTFDSNGSGARLPAIRRLVIHDGKLAIDDAPRGVIFRARVESSETVGPGGHGVFRIVGDGSLNRAAFKAEATGDALLNVSPDRPYGFDAWMTAGPTRITARGTITHPFDLGRLTTRLTVRGPDLNDLYPLTGLTLPNTPPYQVGGQLTRDHRLWKFDRFSGRVGDSDLSGDLAVNTAGKRPLLTGDLRSRRLDFDDLASIFGGAPGRGKGETVSADQVAVGQKMAAQQRLLPDATLQVDRLRAMDAKVTYRAETVNAPNLPLRKVFLDLTLDDGLLTADPLRVTLDRGQITGKVRLNARGATPVTDVDARMTGSDLAQWIPVRSLGQPVIEGPLTARLKLHGTGNSVHRAAANADGTLSLAVSGGQMRQAFAELLGVNLGKGLWMLLSKDPHQTPVRCAVADFKVTNGVARASRVVLDTGVVTAVGSGTVNLDKERMSFRLEGHSKKPRLLRLFLPITAEGPLVKPKLGVEAGPAVVQGGVAVALSAVLSPFAALLPFLEPGKDKNVNCPALLAGAAPLKAGVPPPPKVEKKP
ncbi:uncharacterized protein involved in outer membrane biogenesis [Caulobacter ginsengisoli]|uniref:Uncharacterized protein involved in outer membrane biogenesis n=1 Tax=Caulobacter ginsengisoli TaxID=400775 RepID=A0ABU0IUD0_9CAUL|nr:AsmA family protein [Caulobacter ginsengisoli]MDQ0465609.1 uncharacterized protein involved in outer membrane biogenesis [Caulobacter ginsengisoli]